MKRGHALSMLVSLWPFGRSGSRAVPLKRRLHAWWNGYDLRARSHADSALDDGGAGDASGTAADAGAAGWTDARRELAEEVWTPGFIVPGGESYVQELVNGCTLTSAETMLEINIGTGGGTRTIIGRFGNYVTAYECEAVLAREAQNQAVAYDLTNKLEIKLAPYEDIQVKPRYYRAALIRECLYMMEDKDALIRKVCEGLKDGEAHVIVTDLLFDADDDDPALRAWVDGEMRPVFPWTVDALRKALARHKVTLRIEEDQSKRYAKMVTESWSHYLASIQGKALDEAAGALVMEEAAYWTRRVAALKSGALRYFVFKAVRNT